MGIFISNPKPRKERTIHLFMDKIARDHCLLWKVTFRFRFPELNSCFEKERLMKEWELLFKTKPNVFQHKYMDYLCEHSKQIQIASGLVDENNNFMYKDHQYDSALIIEFIEHLKCIWFNLEIKYYDLTSPDDKYPLLRGDFIADGL